MDPLVFLHDHWAEGAFGYKLLRDDAWPIVKRLWDRYRHDKPETIAQATSNATDLAHRFEAQIIAMHDANLITDEQIHAAMESPAFAQSLQQAFIDGSETASEFKHDQLARLIALQLTSDGESFQSIALRMAAQRMKYLTDRHLRELGLMFAIMDMEFKDEKGDTRTGEEQFTQYILECENVLRPFDGVEPLFLDLQHMEGLSLLRLAPFATQMFAMSNSSQETQSPMLAPLSLRLYGLLKPIGPLDAPPIIGRMTTLMEGTKAQGVVALRGVKLLPPGFLIGYAVYSNLHQTTMVLDGFD